MKIALLKIDHKVQDDVFAELLQQIDVEKQVRIKRFLRYQDRQRSLFADLLARIMLAQTAGIGNADIRFSVLPSGKPVLASHPQIKFNVSHAGDWIAGIVDSQEVGVDVEQEGAIDLSISRSFFCEEEHYGIINDAYPEKKFFDYWTLKESYLKFVGTGLMQPLNSFNIKFLSGNEIRVEANGALLLNVYLKQYPLEDGYKLAVCAEHNEFPESYRIYSYDDLVYNMMSII